MKLLIGNIWTKVQKLEPESKFDVQTPVATAAVRGTEFGLGVRRVQSPRTTHHAIRNTPFEAILTVKEGKVEFFNPFGKVEATEMTESVVKANAAPTQPKRLQSLKAIRATNTIVAIEVTWRLTLPQASECLVFPAGWTGLTVKDVAQQTPNPPSPIPTQVRVVRVMPESPAETAGLKVGDVITAVNGQVVSKAAEVDASILARPQARVALTVLRADGEKTVRVTTASPPDVLPLPRLSRRTAKPLHEATRLLIENKTDRAELALLQLKINWETGKLGNQDKAAVENNLGMLYETKDEMGQAIRHYQRAAQAEPLVALYRFNLGRALKQIGNFERAAVELATAARLAPRWERARREFADVFKLLERGDEALKTVEDALRLNPRSSEAWVVKCLILKSQNHREAARDAALKAIECDPTHAEAHNELGSCYIDLGQFDAAEKAFLKAIELDPNFSSAYQNLGFIHHSRGRLDEAEKMYRKAIELNPDGTNAYGSLGFLLSARRQFDEAEKMLLKAIERDPNQFGFCHNLGGVYRNLRRWDEAEKMYLKAIELAPDFPNAYNNLASVYASRRQFDKAEEMLRKSLALNPNDATVHKNLAWTLAEQGVKLDEALSSAQRAVQAQSNNPNFLDTLGWVHFKRDELVDAEATLKKAIEAYGKSPEAAASWEHLGRVYEKKGDLQAAIEAYHKALSLQPNHKEAKEGVERLQKGSNQ